MWRSIRAAVYLRLALLPCAVAHANPNPQTAIKQMLLGAYGDPNVRPGVQTAISGGAWESGQCVQPADVIHMQIHVTRMLSVDSIKKTWAMDGYLRLWWQDPRLAFDASNITDGSSCVEFLEFSGNERSQLWAPDIYLEDAVKFERGLGSKTKGGLAQYFRVSSDGTVSSSQQTRFELSCNMDFKDAPFDTQRCPLALGLYSQTTSEVQLVWRPFAGALERVYDNCFPGWVVTDVQAANTTAQFAGWGEFSLATATVSFTRVPSSLISMYFVPSMFFVFLSCLGFFINPAATPARVALGIITILTVITNRNAHAKELPTTQETWLARVLDMSLYINLAAFFEQVIVNLGMMIHKWLVDYKARSAEALKVAHAGLAGPVAGSEELLRRLASCSEEIGHLFEIYDVDQDGMISRKEWRRMLRDELYMDASTEVLNQAFTQLAGSKEFISRTMLLIRLTKMRRLSVKLQREKFLARQDSCSARRSPKELSDERKAMSVITSKSVSSVGGASVEVEIEEPDEEGQEWDETVQQSPARMIKVERLRPSVRAEKNSEGGKYASGSSDGGAADVESIKPETITDRHEMSELETHRWSWKLRETALAGGETRLLSRQLKLTIFPYLSHWRFLDHYMRVLFPVVYLVCILYFLALVEFGDVAYARLEKQVCYTSR
jgi:hypothetical protein